VKGLFCGGESWTCAAQIQVVGFGFNEKRRENKGVTHAGDSYPVAFKFGLLK
jgi:hypothetical protein